MAYTTIDRVRNLFDFSADDVSGAQITEFIAYVDAEIEDITGKSPSGVSSLKRIALIEQDLQKIKEKLGIT